MEGIGREEVGEGERRGATGQGDESEFLKF